MKLDTVAFSLHHGCIALENPIRPTTSTHARKFAKRLRAPTLLAAPLVAYVAVVMLLSTCGPFSPRSAPPTPTVAPSPTPSAVPSPAPTATPLPTPTAMPSPVPTIAAATPLPPTATPAPAPTAIPTPHPTPTPDIPGAVLVGDWEGTVKILGSEIPVSASFSVVEGELRGTLDIDSRNIKNLAILAEVLPDGTVRFVIPSQDPPLTFDGMLEGDVITGKFRVGIISGTFVLERVAP